MYGSFRVHHRAMAVQGTDEQFEALVSMVRELRNSNANQSTQIDVMRFRFQHETQGEALAAMIAAMPKAGDPEVGIKFVFAELGDRRSFVEIRKKNKRV